MEISDNPYGAEKVREKVAEIKEKTATAKKLFSFPASEKVIQDYACNKKLAAGRMYITQNFVAFGSSVPKKTEKYPFRKIKSIQKVKLASIRIELKDGSVYDYGGFTQREEAYQILCHLNDNAPTYTLVDTEVDCAPKSPRIREDASMSEIPEEQQILRHAADLVDTGASRRALAKAYEARDMGIATMNEMQRQAELLDDMDQRVHNVKHNLKKTDRHLRGIESIGGALANKMSKDKSERVELVFKARELEIKKIQKKPVKIDCLYKFKNDKLVNARLVFKDREFTFEDEKGRIVEKTACFEYSEVDLVLLRARHQHVDVWFKTGGKDRRIRFMCAHTQFAVNEFSLRVGDELKVEWEPGAKKFDYGSVELSSMGVRSRSAAGGNVFGTKSSSLVSRNASPEIHAALAEQDAHINEIGDVVDDLHGMARAIGTEADRSIAHMQKVGRGIDEIDREIARQNHRVERQIKRK